MMKTKTWLDQVLAQVEGETIRETRLTLLLTEDEKQSVRRCAERMEISMTDFCRHLLAAQGVFDEA